MTTRKRPEKPLQYRVYVFMNGHPDVSINRLCKEFRDEGRHLLSAYHSRWRKCVKPVRWLYGFMNDKWAPVKAITKADKVKLRAIERMIGVE